jgi:hypothetical protein
MRGMALATLALLVHWPIWQPAQLRSACTFASEHAAVLGPSALLLSSAARVAIARFVNGSRDQAPELSSAPFPEGLDFS